MKDHSQDHFQAIAPDPKVHGDEIVDLACKTFGNYFNGHPRIHEIFLGNHHYSFPATRIGLMNGKIVTHFGVFDFQMRVGAARLRTAGIGYVATHPDFRKRGLMAKTARACLAGLRAAGFDFSLLFGLENFYEQFGYTRAWSSVEYTVSLDKLDPKRPAPKLAAASLDGRDDLARLYNRYHDRIAGSPVRPTYRSYALSAPGLFVWNDARGRAAGYVIIQDRRGRLDVPEAAGDSEEILAAVAALARQYACDEIRFPLLAAQTPLARHLCRNNVQVQIRHQRNGEAVGRLIHLPRVLGAMAPDFARRLTEAGMSHYRGKLEISDDRDAATLTIDRGRVAVSPGGSKTPHRLRAGREMSQLILGTDEPGETIAARRMRLSGDAAFLAPLLFTQQHPMLGALERF